MHEIDVFCHVDYLSGIYMDSRADIRLIMELESTGRKR